MNSTTQRPTRTLTTALAIAIVAFLLLPTAEASAQAHVPEAFIGTFMPHGLDGREYVDRHIGELRDVMQVCYEAQLTEAPALEGLMLMRVYVSSNGVVRDVNIVQNRTGSGELATCVEAALELVTLGPNDRNNVSITLPVTFRMRDTAVATASARATSSRR